MNGSRQPQGWRVSRRAWAAGFMLMSCSAADDHQLTAWCRLESRRPTFEIVHVWEGTTEDRLLLRGQAEWIEVARSPKRGRMQTLVLQGGVGVAAHPDGFSGREWFIFRPGTTAPAALPVKSCAVVAGHPSRPAVLCVGPAGVPDSLERPMYDGPRLVEFGPDGAVLSETSLDEPKASITNSRIAGIHEDGSVVVLASRFVGEVGDITQCVLYALAPGRSRLLATWRGAPHPAPSCPWNEQAEVAAGGRVTPAASPATYD